MRTTLIVVLLTLLVGAAVWAKAPKPPKDDPAALLAKSDALYDYPTQHGLTDLAVDLTIPEIAENPVGKAATMSYYYVSEERQRFVVGNIPDKYTQYRQNLESLIDPLSEYVIPRPSAATFAGLTLRAERVYRQFAGAAETNYFQLVGTAKEKSALIQEYRVLLDSQGLACQLENVLKDGSHIIARLDNTKIGDRWHICKLTTRLMDEGGMAQWKIDTIEYAEVDGFVLPKKVTMQYRTPTNQPIKGSPDVTVLFTNYRINKGAAAAALPAK
jgi:hypothetical protein